MFDIQNSKKPCKQALRYGRRCSPCLWYPYGWSSVFWFSGLTLYRPTKEDIQASIKMKIF